MIQIIIFGLFKKLKSESIGQSIKLKYRKNTMYQITHTCTLNVTGEAVGVLMDYITFKGKFTANHLIYTGTFTQCVLIQYNELDTNDDGTHFSGILRVCGNFVGEIQTESGDEVLTVQFFGNTRKQHKHLDFLQGLYYGYENHVEHFYWKDYAGIEYLIYCQLLEKVPKQVFLAKPLVAAATELVIPSSDRGTGEWVDIDVFSDSDSDDDD